MKIVIATRNRHKALEITALLGGGHEFLTLDAFPDAPAVVEDAPDFAGNAAKKAAVVAAWLAGHPWRPDFVLADDSGLEVDALGGAPGVRSARFAATDSAAAGNSPDLENNAKLLRLLREIPPEKRTARFRCVIALAPAPREGPRSASPVCAASEAELGIELFSGSCEGRLLEGPRGTHGFGYDPLFVPDGFSRTFAEIDEAEKNRISHRSRALARVRERLDRMGRGSDGP